MPYSITSSDAETIGRWLIETFTTINLQPEDPPVWFQVWPSFDLASGTADWITDSRILTQSLVAQSPEKVLDAMAAALRALRELQDQEATHGDRG
jgi:hypothetical protein